MNLREPRRQNKQGAVAGGSTEGVTPFFGPAALTTGFKIVSKAVVQLRMHVRFVSQFGKPLEMMTDLSLAAVLFQPLYLFWIRSAVAQGPVDGDKLGMRNRDDCTLTSPAEFDSLITLPEKRVPGA